MAKILIIDDDSHVRTTVGVCLEEAGHIVDEAEDGERGIVRVKSFDPDLILTDIIMPNKEGIETIKALRNSGYRGPIVAMSGGGWLDTVDVLHLAGAFGANASIAKPFKPSELLELIKIHLLGRRVE